MTVRIERQVKVWTVIHSRPEAKNAVDPESAEALEAAFVAFDRDPEAAVALTVFLPYLLKNIKQGMNSIVTNGVNHHLKSGAVGRFDIPFEECWFNNKKS